MFGYNFPTATKLYCVFGKPDVAPNVQHNVEAVVLSDSQLECLAPSYVGLLTSLTSIDLRVSYNLQEYFGLIKIPYFPKVTFTDFNEKFFIQSMSDVTIYLQGSNFMNTATETTCMLENYQGFRTKAFNIYFIDSANLQCSFDMPDTGYYHVLIGNNGV